MKTLLRHSVTVVNDFAVFFRLAVTPFLGKKTASSGEEEAG